MVYLSSRSPGAMIRATTATQKGNVPHSMLPSALGMYCCPQYTSANGRAKVRKPIERYTRHALRVHGMRSLRHLRPLETPESRLGWYIVLGTIPAALAGKLLEKRIEALGNWVIVGSLIVLGLVLLAAERIARHARDISDIGPLDAFLVGCGQALALVPGCSRSGTTLTAGMLLGLKREAAARFSFLLSVPIILGAGAYKLWKALPMEPFL